MTDYSDFTASIADYMNRQDFSPTLMASFVRDAEQKLNTELRVDRMISTAVNTITDSCAPLPDDWLESEFMLMANAVTPTGWAPIRYKSRDEFFRLPNTLHTGNTSYEYQTTYGFYTIEARTIFFGGPADAVNGNTFEMYYFAEVPVFSDIVTSWVYTKYPNLYRYCAFISAYLHAVGEEEKAGAMKQLAEDMIKKLNDQYQRSKSSGSRLAMGRRRSFG
jgi:hypothetical protein